jgi:hypothetical protein
MMLLLLLLCSSHGSHQSIRIVIEVKICRQQTWVLHAMANGGVMSLRHKSGI